MVIYYVVGPMRIAVGAAHHIDGVYWVDENRGSILYITNSAWENGVNVGLINSLSYFLMVS